MISIRVKNDLPKLEKYLKRVSNKQDIFSILSKYGEQGVRALSSATPTNSGETAQSWSYEIVNERDRYEIRFKNSNVNDGVNIAVILQYGHGTRNGGYVEGQDYINPALKPIFSNMANELTKEVGHL